MIGKKPYHRHSHWKLHPIFWSILGLLIIIRLLLPFIILHEANKRLAQLPDYTGHINGVHLALWRGTIEFKDLLLRHNTGDIRLTIDRIIMDFRWGPLVHKKAVIKLWIEQPSLLVLTRQPAETLKAAIPPKAPTAAPAPKGYQSLPDALLALIPFHLEWFQLDGGKAVMRPLENPVPTPKQQLLPPHSELVVTDIQVKLSNLTNSRKLAGTLTAEGSISAQIMSEGRLLIGLRVDPTADTPTFDTTIELKKLDLADLSPLVNWKMALRVKQGLFELYAGASAEQGGFKGYVKPFLGDLKVDTVKGKRSPLKSIEKVVVNVAAKILKNDHTDRVATKIPFQGRFENPHVGLFEAVMNVFRNAFITALQPHLE